MTKKRIIKKKLTAIKKTNMNEIITQVQALQTSDDAALQAIVTALQALPASPVAPTLVSIVATFSDGSTQNLPVTA